MKKLFLTLMLAAGIMAGVQAQSSDKAFGVRLGYGAELSYQQALSGSNRLEADLGLGGWDHTGFLVSGIYQWVFNIQEGLNWYVGPGAQVGLASYRDNNNNWKSDLGIGVVGQIGIEYNFDFPLQLSLDYRPSWMIIPSGAGFGYYGIALGVRYTF